MIGGDDAIPNQHPLADFGQVVISGSLMLRSTSTARA